jgi:hypothetical protein
MTQTFYLNLGIFFANLCWFQVESPSTSYPAMTDGITVKYQKGRGRLVSLAMCVHQLIEFEGWEVIGGSTVSFVCTMDQIKTPNPKNVVFNGD